MAKIDSSVTRVENDNVEMQQVKCKIANVASNKNVSIDYGTDTMVDVLNNIDNDTIPTPSGTLNITSNNTYDVTNYASADVNVVPSLQNKSITITQNGTQTVSADSGYDGLNEVEITTDVSAGGGTGDFWYKIIDYDGTVFKEGRFNNNDTIDLSTITIPTHSGLIFDGWSSTEPVVNNSITCNNNNLLVGAMYTTASGLTEFDIELTKATGLSVTFTMAGQVDWGDGTIETISSSTTHTYNDYGNYTITCDGNTIPSITFSTANSFLINVRVGENVTIIKNEAFQASSNLRTIALHSGITAIQYGAFKYNSNLKSIVLPNRVTEVSNAGFQGCYNLTIVVIPSNATSFNNPFQGDCYNLTDVVLPRNATGGISFQNCYNITDIILPNSLTSMVNSMFQNCLGLANVIFENNSQITSISNSAFFACGRLESITIPSGITSIGTQAFRNCNALLLCDFTNCTAIPTLANTNAFNNINTLCKIVVPDDLYENWIIATNWVNYANYIYKESEVTI